MILRLFPLLALCALAACDSPAPTDPVWGTPAQVVTIGGDTFSVRVAGVSARAVRTNVNFQARRATTIPKGGQAIERVSGCRIRPGSLTGDIAQIEAQLDC